MGSQKTEGPTVKTLSMDQRASVDSWRFINQKMLTISLLEHVLNITSFTNLVSTHNTLLVCQWTILTLLGLRTFGFGPVTR